MGKPIDQITNVLIYKDDCFWLTIPVWDIMEDTEQIGYDIVPEDWGLSNGFESAQDAFAYLTHCKDKV